MKNGGEIVKEFCFLSVMLFIIWIDDLEVSVFLFVKENNNIYGLLVC